MVIQMFGITEQCVKVSPDEEKMGRGLVNGAFRIEYKNATGTVAIRSEDFGLENDLNGDTPVVDDGLLEKSVCISRTPHYLTVCLDDETTGKFTGGTCSSYCEYWPDFKSSDADAPLDKHGNYTVGCSKGQVNTFNGTNSADLPESVSVTEDQRVNAVVLDDKCDANTFLMLDGQIANIQGDLSAPLEVLVVDEGSAYGTSDAVFEFYLNPEDPWLVYPVLKSDLTTLASSAEAEHSAQWRYRVYSMNGVADVCYEGCEDSTAGKRVCHTVAVETSPGNQNIVDDAAEFWQYFYHGAADDTI